MPRLVPISICPLSDSACFPLLSTFPAFILAVVYIIVTLRPQRLAPSGIRHSKLVQRIYGWNRWVRTYLTLEEAEAYLGEHSTSTPLGSNGTSSDATASATERTPLLSQKSSKPSVDEPKPPLLFIFTYTLVPLLESLSWLAIATYHLATLTSTSSSPIPPLYALLLTFTHLAAFLFFVTQPSRTTPPYKLLLLYFLLLVGSVARVGKQVYDWSIEDGNERLVDLAFAAQFADVLALLWVVAVGLCRPMAIPSPHIDTTKIVCPNNAHPLLFRSTTETYSARVSQSRPNLMHLSTNGSVSRGYLH